MSHPPPERRLGTLLMGRYRIESVIGRGGMGVVYGGVHEKLGRPVAVKFLHAELSRDQSALRRFFEEARAAAALEHPNVVAVHDLDLDEEGEAFMVLERLEGESLQDRLARGPIAPRDLREILVPVLDALHRAHQAGIVHRDLKPDNIFLHRPARVSGELVDVALVPKVLDFGIAKLLGAKGDDQTSTGVIIGTPRYMAPEQASGGRIGPWTDVWAVGVVAYRALSGTYPIELPTGLTAPAVLARILVDDPVPLVAKVPSIAPLLADVVDGALIKEVAERTPSARAFAVALQAAVDPDDVTPALDPESSATLPAPESLRPSGRRSGAPTVADTPDGSDETALAATPSGRTPSVDELEDARAIPEVPVGRLALLALIAAVFGVFFVAPAPVPERNLQITLPRRVESGAGLPVRVELSETGVVPRPQRGEARVVLAPVDRDPGRAEDQLASAETPMPAGAARLLVPSDYRGRLTVWVSTLGDEGTSAQTEVEVGLGEAYLGRPRLLMEQQGFELGPRRVLGAPEAAPTRLDVRIEGGSCNPEHGCAMLVWVGDHPASIAVRGVDVVDSGECAGAPEEGAGWSNTRASAHIVRCELRPHGNDADITVVAHRAGQPLAERDVSLPIVLGAPRLDLERTVIREGSPVAARYRRLDPATPVLVDAFQDGHWRDARTFPAGRTGDRPTADLEDLAHVDRPGLWRVQARSSPYDTQNVAARMVLVYGPDESPREALVRRVARGAAGALLDPLAGEDLSARLCEDDPTCTVERYAAFWLAGGELDLIDLPAPISSAEREAEVLAAQAESQRYLVAVVIMLIGLVVAFFAFRSGARANEEAERLLAEATAAADADNAADPELLGHTRRPRTMWQVGVQALLVFLAFVFAAMVVLARGFV